MTNDLMRPPQGALARDEYRATSLQTSNETSAAATAAQAEAEIKSRYVMALQRPRNPDQARHELLRECDRPSFAHVAIWSKPRGGKNISGPSIRFAEACARAWRNLICAAATIYDGPMFRTVRVTVSDLEANLTDFRDVTIQKTVERKKLGKGQQPIGERTNSFGDQVFLVEATDDDLQFMQGSAISKAKRTLILGLLPGDLLEEALIRCDQTMSRQDAADPEAARKKLLDAFGALGITPAQLAQYLGHDTRSLTPEEAKDLRGVYTAVRDGTPWAEILEAKDETAADAPPAVDPAAEAKRPALLKLIAEERTKRSPALWEAACAAAKTEPNANLQAAPVEALAAILAALTPPAKAAT